VSLLTVGSGGGGAAGIVWAEGAAGGGEQASLPISLPRAHRPMPPRARAIMTDSIHHLFQNIGLFLHEWAVVVLHNPLS
jgi:hypothetical protein